MQRLDRILTATGRWSRKEAADLIRAGRVFVDGVPVLRRDEKFPESAHFQVDNENIPGEPYVYLMLNKPAGVVSASRDPRLPTVLSLLPEHLQHVGLFPAGRLDRDTVGLLLLTNDGPLAHRLLAPRHHVDKSYFVCVTGTLDETDVATFQAGMELPDLTCLPARLDLRGPSEALVTLQEGKYHQIKRMFAARGKPVSFLQRQTFGPLTLDPSLEPGRWRFLTPAEAGALQNT